MSWSYLLGETCLVLSEEKEDMNPHAVYIDRVQIHYPSFQQKVFPI